jgi:WD40 repeat protein
MRPPVKFGFALFAILICAATSLRGQSPLREKAAFDSSALSAPGVIALGGPRFAIADQVDTVAFSPDSATLAVVVARGSFAGSPKDVRLFEMGSGRMLRAPLSTGLDGPLLFSRDGKRLWCGDDIWDTSSKSLPMLATKDFVAAISGDERWAVLFKDRRTKMTIWNLRDSVEAATVEAPGGVPGFALAVVSPDGRTIAVSTIHRILELRDLASGKLLHELPSSVNGTTSIAFSPDGKLLASGDSAGPVQIFDVASGKILRTCRPAEIRFPLGVVHFTPNGQSLVAASHSSGKLLIWDPSSGEPIEGFSVDGLETVRDFAFSPDGRFLAIGGTWYHPTQYRGFGPNNNDDWAHGKSSLHVIDWNTRSELFPSHGAASRIKSLAFSPDSGQVAIGTADDEINVLEASNGKSIGHFHGESSGTLAFSADGWILGAADRKGPYHLWSADTGDDLVQLPAEHASHLMAETNCIALSPDLAEIATGGFDGNVRVLTAASGNEKYSFAAYQGASVTAIAYSPDKKKIATAGISRNAAGMQANQPPSRESVRLWDAATGKPVKDLVSTLIANPELALNAGGPNGEAEPLYFISVSFSPDGSSLAAIGSGGTCVWDVENGKQYYMSSGHAGHFSSDGSMLIYVDGESVHAVELASGQICWTQRLLRLMEREEDGRGALAAKKTPLSSIAVSPDGRWVAASHESDTIVSLCSFTPPDSSFAGAPPPTDAEMQRLWATLAETDAKNAYAAMWRLVAAGNPSVEYIHRHFRAAHEDEDGTHISKLIDELDDDTFQVRQQASKELTELGGAAEDSLRRAMRDPKTSLEARLRIEHLLEAINSHVQRRGGAALRRIRAVHVLEKVDTRQALDLLKEFAAAGDTRESRDAQAAVGRREALKSGK